MNDALSEWIENVCEEHGFDPPDKLYDPVEWVFDVCEVHGFNPPAQALYDRGRLDGTWTEEQIRVELASMNV